MINATKIRKGMLVKVDGELYRVHDFQHITPGKGNALMQTKLKSLKTGLVVEARFRPSDKIERANLENRPYEFLYSDENHHIFMDKQTYEQIHLDEELIGDSGKMLKPNQEVMIGFNDGNPVSIDLPKTVDLKVTDCDPGLKGATITNVGKALTLETGLVITGPQFINVGDTVRVDTEEFSYVERVSFG